MKRSTFLSIIGFLSPIFIFAGGEGAPHLNGENLAIFWVLPFVGILLSIAIFPLVAEHFWHHNFGKISLFWALLLILPFTFAQGLQITIYELLHVGLLEYVPFIILLLALFTISGGVQLKGSLVGTPILNTIIIFIGTVLASWMGTTGAAMLLIRPIIRANQNRKNKVHIIVFFIFLVANIGGSLTISVGANTNLIVGSSKDAIKGMAGTSDSASGPGRKANTEGLQLREGGYINRSLLALGNVVERLFH